MEKIMLVLDNAADQNFLEKMLDRLNFEVISMKKGSDLSRQLIDHFPDVVFASTLGKNQKILSALAKIKQARGKPKLVFVRQEREAKPLTLEQQKVIDGVLNVPIDPLKLVELLAETTESTLDELREHYGNFIGGKRNEGSFKVSGASTDYDGEDVHRIDNTPRYENDVKKIKGDKASPEITHVRDTKKKSTVLDALHPYADKNQGNINHIHDVERNLEKTSPTHGNESSQDGIDHSHSDDFPFDASKLAAASSQVSNRKGQRKTSWAGQFGTADKLISDVERKQKYEQFCKMQKSTKPKNKVLDGKRLKRLQKMQAESVSEPEDAKENRKHFLKTLFSMNSVDITKKDD